MISYRLLQSFVRFGLKWYVVDLQCKNLDYGEHKLPSIVVANHPNSFFDAILVAAYSKSEIRFLTRGDIFNKTWTNWLLRSLYMLPIYKRNDDPDAEIKNAFTMDEAVKFMQEGKRIFIFPEGVSRNKYQLQHFMPGGISQLIQRAVHRDVPVQVQPYVLAYSSFDYVPKAASIEALSPLDCTNYMVDGIVDVSVVLSGLREKMEFSIPPESIDPNPVTNTTKEWMKIPAQIGQILHQHLYRYVKGQVKLKTDGTIFFDSILFGVLLFGYPLLVLLISCLIGQLIGFWTGLFVFLLLPFTSYCWVNYSKIKVDKEMHPNRKNSLNKKPAL